MPLEVIIKRREDDSSSQSHLLCGNKHWIRETENLLGRKKKFGKEQLACRTVEITEHNCVLVNVTHQVY